MIVIDGFPLIFPPGGIKSYLFAFLKALHNQPPSLLKNQQFELVVPSFKNVPSIFDFTQINILKEAPYNTVITVKDIDVPDVFIESIKIFNDHADTIRRYTLFAWAHHFLPQYIQQNKPDIILHPYQVVSNYETTAKKYVVVHDIFHWAYLERYTDLEKYFYNTFAKGCANTTKILTISQASKETIKKYLNVPDEKITVCYEGIDDVFLNPVFDDQEKINIRNKYKLPDEYILGFVSVREYKNSIGNIKVLHELIKKGKATQLVLIGGDINTNQTVKQYIEENNLLSYITFIPRLEKFYDLLYLYHLSKFLLFLSYEEGFGLPPLEALGCYTFPLASNKSSMGELYSDYMQTFEPDQAGIIADFILKLTDEERKKIIDSARTKLLALYNWNAILPKYLNTILSES